MRINDAISIPEAELRFVFARGGGPGGQKVNKVETRVTLLFDLKGSPSLSPDQKDRLREKLPGRINREGVLRVVSQRHRTQFANERAARERFVELLREALEEDAPRVATRVPRAARRRRLEDKRHHARVKRNRRPPSDDD